MQSLRSRKEASKNHQRTEPSLFAVPKKDEKKKRPIASWLSRSFVALLFLSLILAFASHHFDEIPIKGKQKAHQHPSKSLFSASGRGLEKLSRKTGKVLLKSITSINKNDLVGLVDDLSADISGVTYEQSVKGREELVAILHDAGIQEMDVPTILSLPKWSSVTKLYGEGPVVVGLETCEKFRQQTPLDDASVGTAGLFNTGYVYVYPKTNSALLGLTNSLFLVGPTHLPCTSKRIVSCQGTLMINMVE
jgi:hypothetical protein